jgi:SAM-dependent methyltransferase
LRYVAQDFCKVTVDEKQGFTALAESYQYGTIDLVSDIVAIPAASNGFDAVLCTEVLEHVPNPVAAIEELTRVLKGGGTLILTVPSNCLRHFDPYFYFSGFSDQFLKHWCQKCGLDIVTIETVGNYWSWLMVEVARSIRTVPWSAPLLLPAFAYYFVRSRFRDPAAEATLCMGYHVIARKR